MRNAFLFRVPGQHGMYDFDEIKAMNLQHSKTLSVTEITGQHHSRGVGKMSVASILSKFG